MLRHQPDYFSDVVPGQCTTKMIGAHFPVITAMNQLFSTQQKYYAYILQAIFEHNQKMPTCIPHSIVQSIIQ
jgi:hypothetical protein